MAGESLFRNLEIEAFRAGITPRTKESIEWVRKKAREMFRGRTIQKRGALMQDDALDIRARPRTVFGNMYMYVYKAKHRDTLPYYDAFPLCIILGPAKDGFFGLNLHYLPPIVRAKALDAIIGNPGNAVPAKFLNAARKHYLTKQVVSKFALVEEPEWEIATFLPTADWRGANADSVYKDSRKKL